MNLFANISIEGSKAYCLTVPSEDTKKNMEKEDAAKLFSVCRSRFLFATANNFGNDAALHKAGKIKNKIISLLKMEDEEGLLRKSSRLKEMLQKGSGYEKYIAGSRSSLGRMLDCYQRRIAINESVEDDGYPNYDYEIESDMDIWRAAELDYETFIEEKDMEKVREWLKESIKEKEEELLGMLSYRQKGADPFDIDAFSDWVRILRKFQKEGLALERSEDGAGGEEGSNKKIKAAAIFWILEVFSDGGLSEISDGKLYIIYDEAHHVGAETVQKFFGELLGTGSKKPYGQGESEYVNNRMEAVSIADLIEEGILKKPDIIRVDDFKDGMPEDDMLLCRIL